MLVTQLDYKPVNYDRQMYYNVHSIDLSYSRMEDITANDTSSIQSIPIVGEVNLKIIVENREELRKLFALNNKKVTLEDAKEASDNFDELNKLRSEKEEARKNAVKKELQLIENKKIYKSAIRWLEV